MDFRSFSRLVLCASTFVALAVNAAEWNVEPSVSFRTQFNDNVRMRAKESRPESSPGYTFDPRVKFKGKELQLWDMSIDARGRVTRFTDVEDADSNNVFFVFDGGRQTERSNWRLNTSYEKNSNLDTDFTTAISGVGATDDRTDRTTLVLAPSVIWSMSEISQMNFSLSTTDVSYGKIAGNFTFRDYTYDSAQFLSNWQMLEKHKLGFTSSYAKYDSPEGNLTYNQILLQMDYTYTIDSISTFALSLGGRRLETTSTGSEAKQDAGTIVNILYNSVSEVASHRLRAGRTVSPSSFGGAQDRVDASYQLSIRNTQRFTTKLILNAFETQTIGGGISRFDRKEYRIEPSVSYKLNRNWSLGFRYRYLNQSYDFQNRDAESNALFINLFLNWPRLVTSY